MPERAQEESLWCVLGGLQRRAGKRRAPEYSRALGKSLLSLAVGDLATLFLGDYW